MTDVRGDAHELDLAAPKVRRVRDGLGCADAAVAKPFRLRLRRGIRYLATLPAVRSVADLVRSAVKKDGAAAEPHVGKERTSGSLVAPSGSRD